MISPSTIPPIASRGPDSSSARLADGPQAAVEGPVPSAWPNPSMRIDPSLGIVVMEFRDRSGSVAATLPTERELAAYRSAAHQSRPEPVRAVPAAPTPDAPPALHRAD
ncbi:hypothetical protein [Belnapia rosea]|uniref:hypothetical protein n=1 Tax=Belnapia rosea TaxID=938405 RepID=UPI0015A0BF86|nr:hypothetical protein [Belnapia rosea]